MSALSRSFVQTTLALLLASWLPLSAHAEELWTVVAKESHFGPGVNTLVIKRRNRTSADQSATDNPEANGRFLVISRAGIYLAVDEQATSPAGAIVTTDSTRWPHMKLIQIGQGIFRDYCFRCRDVIPEDPITLKFSATTIDPRVAMTETLVLNAR